MRLQLVTILIFLFLSNQSAFHLLSSDPPRWNYRLRKHAAGISNLPSENQNQPVIQTFEWVNKADNMVLFPTNNKPKAVIHFLGGAFFGSLPHIFYRSFLESLAKEGYIIVATPFRLQMDYMAVCDEVIRRFDVVASELAREFGPLVVVGVGHSLGAVLQTLITSLFPETPRAINILISFNSRSAIDSVPWYEELVIPLSKKYERYLNESGSLSSSTPRVNKLLASPLDPISALFTFADGIKDQFEQFVSSTTLTTSSPSTSTSNQARIASFYRQIEQFIDQIPNLFLQIAAGQEEFAPSFPEVKEVCRRMYRARRTLVIQFKQDTLDDSEDIASTLREANTIMRMKRPMVEMDVQLTQLDGTHLTPLVPQLKDISLPTPLPTPVPGKSFIDQACSLLNTPAPKLPDCQSNDWIVNVAKEPLNLDVLVEDIRKYLNLNIT